MVILSARSISGGGERCFRITAGEMTMGAPRRSRHDAYVGAGGLRRTRPGRPRHVEDHRCPASPNAAGSARGGPRCRPSRRRPSGRARRAGSREFAACHVGRAAASLPRGRDRSLTICLTRQQGTPGGIMKSTMSLTRGSLIAALATGRPWRRKVRRCASIRWVSSRPVTGRRRARSSGSRASSRPSSPWRRGAEASR
jgi:hypothetical protein